MDKIMKKDEINANLRRIAEDKATAMAAKRRILEARLDFGRRTSALAKEILSTKLLGQEIAKRYPASQEMDVALRSSCRWLHEALHEKEHEAQDILTILDVPSIYDIGSENPVVIRRKYNRKKQLLAAK